MIPPSPLYWARMLVAARRAGLDDLQIALFVGHDSDRLRRMATLCDACWIAHDYLGRLAIPWLLSPNIRTRILNADLRGITAIRHQLQAAHRRRPWFGDWLLRGD